MSSTWAFCMELNEAVLFTWSQSNWVCHVIGHYNGTRDEAMQALRAKVDTLMPVEGRKPPRYRLYQIDNGFMLVTEHKNRSKHTRFTLAEQLLDTHAANTRR